MCTDPSNITRLYAYCIFCTNYQVMDKKCSTYIEELTKSYFNSSAVQHFSLNTKLYNHFI